MKNERTLSKRLQAVADLTLPCHTLADVGTDHAYLPVHLVQQKRAERALALDVREGPLARAGATIAHAGLQDQITARRSDGLQNVAEGEADEIVMAGMGGALMQRILSSDLPKAKAAVLVLQPQSEVRALRSFLWDAGFVITSEDLVCEDGKYYPMMRASYDPAGARAQEAAAGEAGRTYGPLLVKTRHETLRLFLEREHRVHQSIFSQLSQADRADISIRRQEILDTLALEEEVLGYYE